MFLIILSGACTKHYVLIAPIFTCSCRVLQENRAHQDLKETKDPLAQLGCLELTDLVVILALM